MPQASGGPTSLPHSVEMPFAIAQILLRTWPSGALLQPLFSPVGQYVASLGLDEVPPFRSLETIYCNPNPAAKQTTHDTKARVEIINIHSTTLASLRRLRTSCFAS